MAVAVGVVAEGVVVVQGVAAEGAVAVRVVAVEAGGGSWGVPAAENSS